MTTPFPPDHVYDVLSKLFAGSQVPATQPDASAVKPPMRPVAQRTIGPASAPSNLPQPMGGVMGALMSAGPTGEHMLRDWRDHPFASAAELTGIPSIYRGVRDQDVGSIARGAVQAMPYVRGAGRGLSALFGAAPEAAQLMPAAAEAAAVPASTDDRVSAALQEVASNKYARGPGNTWTRTPEMMAMREERRKLMAIPRAGGLRAGDAAAGTSAEANPFVERASRMADSVVARNLPGTMTSRPPGETQGHEGLWDKLPESHRDLINKFGYKYQILTRGKQAGVFKPWQRTIEVPPGNYGTDGQNTFLHETGHAVDVAAHPDNDPTRSISTKSLSMTDRPFRQAVKADLADNPHAVQYREYLAKHYVGDQAGTYPKELFADLYAEHHGSRVRRGSLPVTLAEAFPRAAARFREILPK